MGIYGKYMKCSTVDNEVVSEKCPDKTKTWCGNMFHDIINRIQALPPVRNATSVGVGSVSL